jgi:hypothetical protein
LIIIFTKGELFRQETMILGKIGSKTGVVETELFAHITLYVIFDRFMKVKICPSNSAC